MAVLDIGCGCGATTLELAARVGPAGRVLGMDVSEPMLARAADRLSAYPWAELVLADASAYAFAPFAELAISRFGVMFFGESGQSFRQYPQSHQARRPFCVRLLALAGGKPLDASAA